MANDVSTLSGNLAKRSSNQLNRQTPFKESFRQLGGGGKAAQASIGQKEQRLKKTGDIVQQKGLARRSQINEQQNTQAAQFNQQLQDSQEELQMARTQAIDDVNEFVKDKQRERQIYLEALEKRKQVLRKQLQGQVDEETLAREMEGINQLISGASSLFMTAGLPAIQDAMQGARQGRLLGEAAQNRNLLNLRQGIRGRFDRSTASQLPNLFNFGGLSTLQAGTTPSGSPSSVLPGLRNAFEGGIPQSIFNQPEIDNMSANQLRDLIKRFSNRSFASPFQTSNIGG